MDRYYKHLMNRDKTMVAGFLDGLSLLLMVTVTVFIFTLINVKSIVGTIIITSAVDILTVMLIYKAKKRQVKKFRKSLDEDIRKKLILERVMMNKHNVHIKGYLYTGNCRYINLDGEKTLLLAEYPNSVLTPKDIKYVIQQGYKEIIASCDFDDDCILLCSRMGIELKNKEWLLENIEMDIDESEITSEIKKEIIKINDIKNKRKSTALKKNKWNKYLKTAIILFILAGFMGRYRIFYLSFAGMCLMLSVISLVTSNSQ